MLTLSKIGFMQKITTTDGRELGLMKLGILAYL